MITKSPVLVTGVTGFVASRIVEQLLVGGYRVRGTVRSLGKEGEIAPLRALAGAAERLELVEADLLAEGSFDAAAKGCEQVMHTASPYVIHVADPQTELVEPAVKGTITVLESCVRAGSVKRVVLTSSMAAVTDEPESDRVLTENDWNTKSSVDRNPSYYSKTLAERSAWDFMKGRAPGFDLVVVNPYVVIGPSLVPSLNVSNGILVDLLKGTYPGVMRLAWGMVDVRDVARAHIAAMETPNASGRYLCVAGTMRMREVLKVLAGCGYGKGYKLPTIPMDNAFGDGVVRLASYLQPKGVGTYLRTHVGRVPRYDTTKIRMELGMSFRPVAESIVDTMGDLERWGHLPKKR